MRIAFVAETLGCPMYLGGISRYTLLLGQALTDLGHEVHVYTRATRQQAACELGKHPFVLHHIIGYSPKLFGFRTLYYKIFRPLLPGYCFVNEWAIPLVWHVYKDAKANVIDIIEAPETGGFLAIGARLISRHVPVVGRLHAPSSITASDHHDQISSHLRQLVRMELLFLRQATAMSAPSQSVANIVQRQFGDTIRIEIIPNPVNVPEVAVIDVRHVQKKHVVFVGRLEILKGFDAMMRAIPKVVARIPNVIFDIAGPDTVSIFGSGIEQGLQKYMSPEDAIRLAPSIRFHGQVTLSQADEIRSVASCVVVPSTYENFPYTLTEAMALSRPVVATRVGGMAEIITADYNGQLIEVGSSEAFAEAVIELLVDTDKAHALGQQAKREIEVRYSPGVVAGAMADFYSRVLST